MGNAVPNRVIGWSSARTGRWLKMCERHWSSSRKTGIENTEIGCQIWHQRWRPPRVFLYTVRPPAEKSQFGRILLKYICHSNLPANLVGAFIAANEEKIPAPSAFQYIHRSSFEKIGLSLTIGYQFCVSGDYIIPNFSPLTPKKGSQR